MLTTAARLPRPGPVAGAPAPLPSPVAAARPWHPAAASVLAPAWLHGPVAPARVVAVFGTSAYVLRDDEVLAVVAPGALVLPGALRLARVEALRALRLDVGDEVVVGGGRMLGPHGGVEVRRTWRPRPVPVAPLEASRAARAHDGLGAVPTDDLPADVVSATAGLLSGDVPQASRLVGLGPGLTPAGDDALCGLLLGLRATGHDADRARLERDVIPLLGRTTALSATLLRHAAAGYAVPPVVQLLHAWHQADVARADLASLTREVAAVGHTSGRAVLLGLSAALAHAIPFSRKDRRD
jgi:hypothetical protein